MQGFVTRWDEVPRMTQGSDDHFWKTVAKTTAQEVKPIKERSICALAEFRILPHKAQRMTKRELSMQTPDCIGTKLLITSTALRAYRNRHLGTLMRCCEAWTPLKTALTHFSSNVLISSDLATSLLALLVKT